MHGDDADRRDGVRVGNAYRQASGVRRVQCSVSVRLYLRGSLGHQEGEFPSDHKGGGFLASFRKAAPLSWHLSKIFLGTVIPTSMLGPVQDFSFHCCCSPWVRALFPGP